MRGIFFKIAFFLIIVNQHTVSRRTAAVTGNLLRYIRKEAAHQETENSGRRKRFEPFKTLGRYKVFQAQTYIETANLKTEDAFRKAAGYMFPDELPCRALQKLPSTAHHSGRSD